MQLPKEVQINEVGIRDGLQLEEKILSVEEKVDLIEMLAKANVQCIEFGSFVHPKFVPQMANSSEVFDRVKNMDGIRFIGLVPNLKGVQNAIAAGVKHVNFVFSASNTHNLQNVKKTTEQSLEEYKEIYKLCNENGLTVDCVIATAFGCPFEGTTPKERVLSIVDQLIQIGVNTISLADTTGMTNPKQVFELCKTVLDKWPEQKFNLHFHNTRGMGLSNVLAGMEAGITSFDAALGGLGGCPFAPGATGNICTEDVVHMLEEMGINTNINLDLLIDASKKLREYVGHELPGQVVKAGKSSRRYPVPEA